VTTSRGPFGATRLVIIAFLDAYNAGAPDVTDRFIATAEQSPWFGAPGRQFPDDPVSTDRAALPAYFASAHQGRQARAEVFQLLGRLRVRGDKSQIPRGDRASSNAPATRHLLQGQALPNCAERFVGARPVSLPRAFELRKRQRWPRPDCPELEHRYCPDARSSIRFQSPGIQRSDSSRTGSLTLFPTPASNRAAFSSLHRIGPCVGRRPRACTLNN
jgi:hypothetical protein